MEKINNMFDCKMPVDIMYKILFEMNRFYDKNFTLEVQNWQKENKVIFNQNQRNILRKYYYYSNPKYLQLLGLEDFPVISSSDEDRKIIEKECTSRIKKYGKEKIIGSIKQKYMELEEERYTDYSKQWLSYYNDKRKNSLWSAIFIEVNQEDFSKNNYNIEYLYQLISNTYEKLENYRYMLIHITENIEDQFGNDVTWKLIYKLTIYAENFIQYKEKYFPCKKEKLARKLEEFLLSKYDSIDAKKLAGQFYRNISTGYQYEDCLVNDKCTEYILSFKKIKLDQSPIPCPACMTTIQSGNSYPAMFLRSYECKNPDCPERSKSGRGKRFDDYGQYRFFKMVENDAKNIISSEMYSTWRRDIFSSDLNCYDMLINYYLWSNETFGIYNSCMQKNQNLYGRRFVKIVNEPAAFLKFEELPIVHLFQEVGRYKKSSEKNIYLEQESLVVREDSTEYISKLVPNQIGAVVTSPPYYNAREYSQWSNLILYFVDVLRNTQAIKDAMINDGFYLYNIGDVVNADNVYVESNMSKRRIPLGAYSSMIFEIAGLNLVGNIIWDKGQVQSKRNSTINLNSGYVKFINCYEHVLVFKNGAANKEKVSKVTQFSPVIKINSKGQNTYKHTAPYPPELVALIEPFIKKDFWTLDPYLGSGTTVKWCREKAYKSIGIEMNEEYYSLCLKRIFGEIIGG